MNGIIILIKLASEIKKLWHKCIHINFPMFWAKISGKNWKNVQKFYQKLQTFRLNEKSTKIENWLKL